MFRAHFLHKGRTTSERNHAIHLFPPIGHTHFHLPSGSQAIRIAHHTASQRRAAQSTAAFLTDCKSKDRPPNEPSHNQSSCCWFGIALFPQLTWLMCSACFGHESRPWRRPSTVTPASFGPASNWLTDLAACVGVLIFHKAVKGCTVPGDTAMPGRCVEWTEQAPVSAPGAKNGFNM